MTLQSVSLLNCDGITSCRLTLHNTICSERGTDAFSSLLEENIKEVPQQDLIIAAGCHVAARE